MYKVSCPGIQIWGRTWNQSPGPKQELWVHFIKKTKMFQKSKVISVYSRLQHIFQALQRKKKIMLQCRNLTNIASVRQSKQKSVINHVDNIYLWHKVMKMTLNLCDLPPPNPKLQSYYEKLSSKNPRGAFCKYLTNNSQECQGHQKQGKSEKLSQTRGA